MTFSQDDLIEFENGEKVVVLDSIMYEDKEYCYVNVLKNDSMEPGEKYRTYSVNFSDGTLDEVKNEELLKALAPVFYVRLQEKTVI